MSWIPVLSFRRPALTDPGATGSPANTFPFKIRSGRHQPFQPDTIGQPASQSSAGGTITFFSHDRSKRSPFFLFSEYPTQSDDILGLR
jgi:hypothetical protein